MSKLIIWVEGRPNMNGPKRGSFHWSEAHGCYIYGGREIPAAEFNAVYDRARVMNPKLTMKVRVVDVGAAQATIAAPIKTPPTVTAVANVATITMAREITVEEAEAVMVRLAPERLKKKTGKPPEAKPMMEVA